MRRLSRVLLVLLLLLLVVAAGVAAWARSELRASLAQLDGERTLPGLSAPVDVTRDELGIPIVRGATRADVARATGFLHAQERFFQMDLARRRAAGELSALVGPLALDLDQETRIHRFRAVARQALALTTPGARTVLDAYTAGVNAGLDALGAAPFEYLMLRRDPQAWRAEDSLLVVLSMFLTLQESDGEYEATLATMHEMLPAEMVAFLVPPGSEWDAPIVGDAFRVPPIPGPEVYDLRSRSRQRPPRRLEGVQSHRRPEGLRLPGGIASQIGNQVRNRVAGDLQVSGSLSRPRGPWDVNADPDSAIGSNNFAVDGSLTAGGGALVANDMHLAIRVPNIWYRAVLEWPGPDDSGEPYRVAGVTLPGVPAVVVGSNTHIAWGFTNTYADWSDIVLLEVDPARPGEYLTPHGWRPFDRYDEVVEVAGGDPVSQTVLWTIWGPVFEPDFRGRPRAYRWVAHSATQLAVSITPFESARTVDEAFEEANGLGTPGQNLVVGDRTGRIGWSVYGSIPRRVGLDGRLPASWADGTRGWDGWLGDEEYPRVADPAGGRIWTANSRVVDGPMLAALGDGNWEVGSRASLIRDRLFAKERFTAADLLDIQLDIGSGFLERWRDLLLRTLTPPAIDGDEARAELRRIVEEEWSGQVTPGNVAYRLTRAFREAVSARVMGFVLSECYEADPTFDYTAVRRREAAVWAMADRQPQHLLDPAYASWIALLVAAADETIAGDGAGTGPLDERVWSEYNATAFRHPLSRAAPLLHRWLDMPPVALPGDRFTPRVHWGDDGASERMVVSPGREAEGILHMPTGQSGHPMSPFYANSHPAWVNGEATPFLPGPARHDLRLIP